jgi:hypothetical protein
MMMLHKTFTLLALVAFSPSGVTAKLRGILKNKIKKQGSSSSSDSSSSPSSNHGSRWMLSSWNFSIWPWSQSSSSPSSSSSEDSSQHVTFAPTRLSKGLKVQVTGGEYEGQTGIISKKSKVGDWKVKFDQPFGDKEQKAAVISESDLQLVLEQRSSSPSSRKYDSIGKYNSAREGFDTEYHKDKRLGRGKHKKGRRGMTKDTCRRVDMAEKDRNNTYNNTTAGRPEVILGHCSVCHKRFRLPKRLGHFKDHKRWGNCCRNAKWISSKKWESSSENSSESSSESDSESDSSSDSRRRRRFL